MAPLDPGATGTTGVGIWSPDGQWILYARVLPATSEIQVVRIRPGSTGNPEVLAAYSVSNAPESGRPPVAWSPAGDGILAVGRDGAYLMSPDYKTERKITSRKFDPTRMSFSKDGRQVLGMFRNTTGQGAEWQLYSIDVRTGAEKLLAGVELPVTTDDLRGLSLHPDGTRFLTSIAKWPFDIWMLEGFE